VNVYTSSAHVLNAFRHQRKKRLFDERVGVGIEIVLNVGR
jgi:hypothetical protein